jgi:hypothetical protein
MTEDGHDSSKMALFARGISATTIGLALALFGLLLFAADRGLDYSDESYSYLWARYPYEYRFALRLSGFFLHPVELLAQHSLTGLRMAGMMFSAASGVLIGVVLANATGRAHTRWERAELVSACGIAMFLGNIHWINTPSYQHMAAWGLAMWVAGFVILIGKAQSPSAQRFSAAPLIAAGGLILAFAKVPSAMAAALLTIGLILFAHQGSLTARLRMLRLIAFVEMLLLVATAILLSPSHVLEVFREGLSVRGEYGGLRDVLAKHLVDIENIPTEFVRIFAVGAASMILAAAARWRRFGAASLAASLVLGAAATYEALIAANPVRPIFGQYSPYDHGLRMSALAFAVLALACAAFQYRKQRSLREYLILAGLLMLAPWIASLGTGNNILSNIAFYSGFFGLVIIFITLEMPQPVAQAARLFIVLMSGATLYFAAQHPYRLNRPIAEQNVPLALDGLNGNRMLFDAPTASFFATLHDRARTAGLPAGTPLFDLAGHGPGLNLVLGTKPPAYPWIAAGYPNSPAILDKIWLLTPVADRARAWIVGPIDDSFRGAATMSELMPLDTNYESVLTIVEPRSGRKVELWRPRKAAAAGGL